MKIRQVKLDVAVTAMVGVAYVTIQYWMPVILSSMGEDPRPTVGYWQIAGTRRLLFTYGLQLILLLFLFAWAAFRGSNTLRRINLIPFRRDLMFFGVPTIMISLLLAVIGVWPWTWQWPPHTAIYLGNALISGHQFVGLLIWAVATICVIPIMEEIFFRFAALRLFESVTGSTAFGILASSLLFAGAHLGGFGEPDRAHSINALWLLLGSLGLGFVTVRKQGRLGPAITVHAARNALEFSMLLVALFQN